MCVRVRACVHNIMEYNIIARALERGALNGHRQLDGRARCAVLLLRALAGDHSTTPFDPFRPSLRAPRGISNFLFLVYNRPTDQPTDGYSFDDHHHYRCSPMRIYSARKFYSSPEYRTYYLLTRHERLDPKTIVTVHKEKRFFFICFFFYFVDVIYVLVGADDDAQPCFACASESVHTCGNYVEPRHVHNGGRGWARGERNNKKCSRAYNIIYSVYDGRDARRRYDQAGCAGKATDG